MRALVRAALSEAAGACDILISWPAVKRQCAMRNPLIELIDSVSASPPPSLARLDGAFDALGVGAEEVAALARGYTAALAATPFFLAPPARRRRCCAYKLCDELLSTRVKVCAACRSIFYCREEHQEEAFPEHEGTCMMLKALRVAQLVPPPPPPQPSLC